MARTRRASQLAESSQNTDLKSESDHDRPTKKAKLGDSQTNEEGVMDPRKASTKKSRKTKLEPAPEDYPKRTESLWKAGAHVSSAGGVENAVLNAAEIGANAFALFLKSQRKWSSPPLKDMSIAAFKKRMADFGYDKEHVLPHGSYLINLGNPDKDKREKSYECFLDDLQRCEQLGLKYYNFHPGSTVGVTTPAECISSIAECINRAHKATQTVVPVIENMAGAGNIIGSDFAQLASIIEEVEDKSRIGVCLDTCHMFAAGYDIRTAEGWNKTLNEFDAKVGLSYLRGMHLNDSKAKLNSKRDRHENLGLGHLGITTFRHILTDPRVQNIPLVLETQNSDNPKVWAKEIEALNFLSSAGPSTGNKDGEEIEKLVDGIKKIVKESEAAKESGKGKRVAKGKGKDGGRKKKKDEDEDEGEEEDEEDDE